MLFFLNQYARQPGFLKLLLLRKRYKIICVCVSMPKLIANDVIWALYDWLNNFQPLPSM